DSFQRFGQLGRALVAIIFFACVAYAAARWVRRTGIPRAVLAGAFASLLVAIFAYSWPGATSADGTLGRADQQLALLTANLASPLPGIATPHAPPRIASVRSDGSARTPRKKALSPLVGVEEGRFGTRSLPDKTVPDSGRSATARPMREYAYSHPADKRTISIAGETIYWHPALLAENGEARITFDLPESAGA